MDGVAGWLLGGVDDSGSTTGDSCIVSIAAWLTSAWYATVLAAVPSKV